MVNLALDLDATLAVVSERNGGANALQASSQRMFGPHGWSRKYGLRLFFSDAFVVTMVMVVAHGFRFGWNPSIPVSGPAAPPYWFVSLGIAALWLLQLTWTHSRQPRILGHGPQEFQRVVSASWRTFTIVAVIGFLTQWQISRGYLLFALPVGTIALLVYRAAWRMWIHVQRDAGQLRAQVLVVGPHRTTAQMIRRLRRSPRAGFNVIAVCVPPSKGEPIDEVEGVPIEGAVADAVAVAVRVGAEFIVISGTDALSLAEARRIGWGLEGTGVGLLIAPAVADIAGPRVSLSPVEGLPLLHVDPATFGGARYLLKAAADRVAAVVLLAGFSIPMLAIAALVRVTSPGPALFRQVRVGQNGRSFDMFKFRSMVTGAEARLTEVVGDEVGVYYKPKDDPRVTKVGRVLRRYSLDELPQLLNVVRGEMSIVGPRPQVAAEVAQYTDLASRRLLVKPGMTGLWQVSGRSSLTPEESIRLDAYYAENWTLGGDVLILARTLGAVLSKNGAY
jgi:exopolysaccharide biosynthesis polyprenyl glycosylphosphotransferase